MKNLNTLCKHRNIRVHLLSGILILTLTLFFLSPSSMAHAAIIAEFTVTSLSQIANTDDSEGFLQYDPDLYYVMGIFDQASSSSSSTWDVFGETNLVSTTGTWNIPDTTISREVHLHRGYFYFALIDDDLDSDDLLGDHWFFANSDTSGSFIWNNNAAPFLPTALGLDTEGNGWSVNYRLNYEVTFTDTTVPTVPIPGALWLLGSGLICLAGLRKKRKR